MNQKDIFQIKLGIIFLFSFLFSVFLSIEIIKYISGINGFFIGYETEFIIKVLLVIFFTYFLYSNVKLFFVKQEKIIGKQLENMKRLFFIKLLLIISFFLLFYWLTLEDEYKIPEYLHSSECPEGQVIGEWIEYHDDKIDILSCITPYSCNDDEKDLRSSCEASYLEDRLMQIDYTKPFECELKCEYEPMTSKP